MESNGISASSLPTSESPPVKRLRSLQMTGRAEDDIETLLTAAIDRRISHNEWYDELTLEQKHKTLEWIGRHTEVPEQYRAIFVELFIHIIEQESAPLSEDQLTILVECLKKLTTVSFREMIPPHLITVIYFCCKVIRNSATNQLDAMVILEMLCKRDARSIPAETVTEIFSCSLLFDEPTEGIVEWESSDCLEEVETRAADWFGRLYKVLSHGNNERILDLAYRLSRDDCWKMRYCAVLAFYTIGENLTSYIVNIAVLINRFINDSHARVRSLVCRVLERYSTDCKPLFQIACHEMVVPDLVSTLNDLCPRVAAHAARTLATFFKNCPAFVANEMLDLAVLNDAIERALKLLLTEGKTLMLQEIVSMVSAAAQLVASAKDHLEEPIHYYELMPKLKLVLRECPESRKLIRANAFCSIVYVIRTAQEKYTDDDVRELLHSVAPLLSSLSPIDPECPCLMNALFGLYVVYYEGEAFTPFLPLIIPVLISVARFDVADYTSDNPSVDISAVMDGVTRAARFLEGLAHDIGDTIYPYVNEIVRVMMGKITGFDGHKSTKLFKYAATTLSFVLPLLKERRVASARSLWHQLWPALTAMIERVDDRKFVVADLIEAMPSCVAHFESQELDDLKLHEMGSILKKQLEDVIVQEGLKWTRDWDFDDAPKDSVRFRILNEEEGEEHRRGIDGQTAVLQAIAYLALEVFNLKECDFFPMVEPMVRHIFILMETREDWAMDVLDTIVTNSPDDDEFFDSLTDWQQEIMMSIMLPDA